MLQALQRARDTPGFAQRAAQAQQAYEDQAACAARAVEAWADQHGHELGKELRWCVTECGSRARHSKPCVGA